jgi:hypothetical protein
VQAAVERGGVWLLDRYISDRPAARASRGVYAMSDSESISKKIETE